MTHITRPWFKVFYFRSLICQWQCADISRCLVKKPIFDALVMARRTNFTSFYLLAVLICIGIGVITKDKYIGLLLAVAAVLWIAGIQSKRNRNAN